MSQFSPLTPAQSSAQPSRSAAYPFLAAGGEAAAIIADYDWGQTSLGAIATWTESLKSTISLILHSPVPIVTLWNDDGVMIYNDAYSVFAGKRHPRLFGSRVREGWPEVAAFNDNVMRTVLSGKTLAYADQELTLFRNGVAEQVWMNLDYSPILDTTGKPAGVIAVVVETTAKIRAQRDLIAERESLRQLFEQAPGIIATLSGPDHTFTMANAACLRMIGGRELIGRSTRSVLPEAEAQGFVAILDKVYRDAKPFVGRGLPWLPEYGDGGEPRQYYVDFVFQPILGDDGRTSGIFIQGHDVTEQKQAELALRESEERFRLVAEDAAVMLWMADPKGRCVYVNRAMRAFLNITQEQAPSFPWATLLHPDDRAYLTVATQKARQTSIGFSAECRVRRADGAWRQISTSIQPRSAPNGHFLGLIGVNVDITDERAAQIALRRETRVLTVLNETGTAIAAQLDLTELVQMVTDAGVEMSGAAHGAFFYNVVDEAGESYMLYALSGAARDTFRHLAMPRATKLFQPTFRGDRVVRSDDIVADPAYGLSSPYFGLPVGHVSVRSYLAVPVKSRSGAVLGALLFGHPEPGIFKPDHERLLKGVAAQAAIAIDNARLFQAAEREIAERKRAEAALQALNATLEERVAEAVREQLKAEEALRHSQKMEAIGKLTGGVAHDFNNLLQVVSGNLQLLSKDVSGNRRAERRVESALVGVDRGAKLASQLLAFGRRQALEPRVVNIGHLVAGMADMLLRTIGEGIEITTVLADGLWNTFVDPGQLENALLNLAINARDAMDGRGRLTIEVQNTVIGEADVSRYSELAPGAYVMVAIADTGPGMSQEVVDRAFEPFFSTKPQGKGSGLGLSMVYGFVKQSGGFVNIETEIGKGTRLRLYLPPTDEAEDGMIGSVALPVTGGEETILIAEDDEAVRNTVVEILGELGYRIIAVRDASEALAVIESGISIDLFFTDVIMPGPLSSADVARRARDRRPRLAVLFTSGYTENSIVHGGRLDPGLDLLPKPYSREALARKIRQVLDASAAAGRVHGPKAESG
jgi:PAS domain S-box-containing protein